MDLGSWNIKIMINMKGYGKTIHAKIPKVFIHLKTEINSLAILRKIYLKDKDL
jgi:hypothetical protein